MKKKRVITTATIIILIFISINIAIAENSIKVVYEGTEIKSTVSPQVINGRIMVPLRAITEALGFDVEWNPQKNVVNISKKKPIQKIVARLPEADVTLSATENKERGIYENLKLQIGGMTRSFSDWKNVDNPTYAPKLFFNDLNQDGKKELVVVLTEGYGTGLLLTEAHVFHQKYQEEIGQFYEEVLVDNPMAIVYKNVKTKLTPHQVEITIDDKKTIVDISNIPHQYLYNNVAFGSIIEFDVVDNRLVAIVNAVASDNSSIGEIYITYEFKDNIYQAQKIEFKTIRSSQ